LAIRRTFVILITGVAAISLAVACSETTRYRVLSFFFDGVPKPGAARPEQGGAPPVPGQQLDGSAWKRPPAKPVIYHQPYAEHRCDACHSRETGLLLTKPGQGLCRTCHPDTPGAVQYVHGPVAVGDCLACHHPHGSTHPWLLLEDPKDICFRCHFRDDVMEGEYHAGIEGRSCLECHDPHGADNEYFLKRSER
jgi:predicted CXXCH cytochrome family protein